VIPKKEHEAVQALLARPETTLMGIERQVRFCLLMGLTHVPCPMCFEPVNRYEAGDDTQAVGELYEGKYICPSCDTELAYCVPFIMQPGTPGWHWRRKEPIPNRKQGPHALAQYHMAQARKYGTIGGDVHAARQKRIVAIETGAVWPEQQCPDCNAPGNEPCAESCPLRAYAVEFKKKTLRPGDTSKAYTQAPPTDPQPDLRHTVPPQVRWHVSFRCADRQVILDQNKLFIAEAVEGAAALVASAPELLDYLDQLVREHAAPEALALVERLRASMKTG
jgi:hypothetical protein